MNLKLQKYGIISSIVLLNTILISTFIYYNHYWYAFLFILASESFINSSSVILICLNKFYSFLKASKLNKIEHTPKNYIYLIPCYNESEEELTNSINSLSFQKNVFKDNKLLFIICDGKVKGPNNQLTTDKILKKILNVNNDSFDYYDYTTWDNSTNIIQVYSGKYQIGNIDYILCIKNKNYGKRDSITLARRLAYNYNLNNNDKYKFSEIEEIKEINKEINKLESHIFGIYDSIFNDKINYIIGIDADTIFEPNCANQLINGLESNINNYGCVGYVDISPKMNSCSLFTIYQYAEYTYAQCLKRLAQSLITHKVSCLSGCNQILKVCRETCGPEILNAFNRLPKPDENIFNHIRSYASEDRNHVCLMLSMYPYARTVQNIKAVAYTMAPNNVSVFLSQRRRWNLGANCNDMLLTYLPGINIFERFSALVNIITFITSPFICVATAYFFKVLFTDPPILMLYLSVIIIIPFIYALLMIPIIRNLSLKNTMYYYLSYILYLTIGNIVNILTYSYALLNMDTINWGKTRKVIESKDESYKSDKSLNSDEISISSLINDFYKYLYKNNFSDDNIEYNSSIENIDHDPENQLEWDTTQNKLQIDIQHNQNTQNIQNTHTETESVSSNTTEDSEENDTNYYYNNISIDCRESYV
jgi:chitin synthase